MATAKKLPSGSWRCRVYDYTDESGKKHYKSFTSDNPKPAGKREAEAAAAAYAVSKKTTAPRSLTFQAALEAYIDKRSVVLSPSSVREYKRAKKNYDDLKDIRIDDITQEDIQKHVNAFNEGHSPKNIIKSPKSYAGDRFIDFPSFITDKIPKGNGRVTELNPNMITQRFNHVLMHAGVPHFRFHDCRHYCASIMHAIGVPDAYIMERGGWGNDGTLKNVYRHAMADQREKMSDKTNGHFDAMYHSL